MNEPQTVNELLKAVFEAKRAEHHTGRWQMLTEAWDNLRLSAMALNDYGAEIPLDKLALLSGRVARAKLALANATPNEPTNPPSGTTEQDLALMAKAA